jgi:hypothetical protein
MNTTNLIGISGSWDWNDVFKYMSKPPPSTLVLHTNTQSTNLRTSNHHRAPPRIQQPRPGPSFLCFQRVMGLDYHVYPCLRIMAWYADE